MHRYTKRLWLVIICSALFAGVVANVFAVLPPKYLAIKDFKQCLAVKNMGTWSAWCLPQKRPDKCPADS